MLKDEKLEGYYAVRVDLKIQEEYRKLPREKTRKVNDEVRKLLRKLIIPK